VAPDTRAEFDLSDRRTGCENSRSKRNKSQAGVHIRALCSGSALLSSCIRSLNPHPSDGPLGFPQSLCSYLPHRGIGVRSSGTAPSVFDLRRLSSLNLGASLTLYTEWAQQSFGLPSFQNIEKEKKGQAEENRPFPSGMSTKYSPESSCAPAN
jgi:hypothetical protein